MQPLRLLPLLLLAAALAAQDKAPLRLAPPVGSPLFFRYAFDRTQTTEVKGQELVFGLRYTHLLKLVVTKVGDDGTAAAELTVLHTKGAATAPGDDGDVAFDSTCPAEDEQGIGPVVCAFAGHTFALRIGKNGEVQELKGADEVLAEVAKKATGRGKQLLAAQITAATLKNAAQTVFGRFPDEPVAIGGSWTREVGDELKGTPMVTKTKTTLRTRSAAGIELAVEGTITTPDAKPEQMHLKAGKLEGVDTLDAAGLVLHSTRKTSTTSEGPSPIGSGTIEVASETSVTVARVSEAAATGKAGAEKAEKPAEKGAQDPQKK